MSYRQWHRVLVHALSGVDDPGLGDQPAPDLDALAVLLARRSSEIGQLRGRCLADGRPWPVPPPPELADGLPWAQYSAALGRLRQRLGWSAGGTDRASGVSGASGADGSPGAAQRAPASHGRRSVPREDPETRRLLADRPPHWG